MTQIFEKSYIHVVLGTVLFVNKVHFMDGKEKNNFILNH